MRLIRDSSEEEMIAEFLRQEFAAHERYGAELERCLRLHGAEPRLITHPDLRNGDENVTRRRILGSFRGYGEERNSFFTDFPAAGVRWNWMEVSRDELLETHLIRYCADHWNGCRSPRRVAAMIRSGGIPDQTKAEGTIERIMDLATVIRASSPLPPLLLVSADEGETRVAMEGNTRLIAYALSEEGIPDGLTVLVGFSPHIARWDEY